MKLPGRSLKLQRIFSETIGDPKLGAEIGVQFGKNAFAMLTFYPSLHLQLVDCYDDSICRAHPRFSAAEVQTNAVARLSSFSNRVVWSITKSFVAAELIKNKSLDYVFIDAGHDYNSVKVDIESWRWKVRDGGLLLGHDFNKRFPGVRQAVMERFTGRVHKYGDVWWVQC
jgi:predicted O-methyltransferase YrrM